MNRGRIVIEERHSPLFIMKRWAGRFMEKMQREKKKKRRNIGGVPITVIGAIVIVCLGGFVMFEFWNHYNQKEENRSKEDVISYVETYLSLELDELVEEAEGQLQSGRKGEQAYLKLKIASGYEQQIMELLRNKYGESQDSDGFPVPGYQGHSYAKEIENGKIKAVFFDMRSGKRAKTRSVELYLVESKGVLYLYFMG